MSVCAFDLIPDGVVIVESTSGLPMPMSFKAFVDADEGNAFLAWVDLDPRRRDELHDPALAMALLNKWRKSYEDDRPSAA